MYRADHRLRILENGVLRKMFGPESEGKKGSWRVVELFCYLCSSATEIRWMRGVWHVERMGKKIRR
jgi:hypothetical protein